MNRFGKLVTALLLLALVGFVSLLRPGQAPAPPTPVATPAPDLTPGVLSMPVAGVAPGALTDMFADERGERTHGALDIMAARGTPVLAAAGGMVEKLHESEAGGMTAYVRSADGRWVHYYAHLDRYAAGLREGLYVPRGGAIGTVGSTGNANPEGPHLHFEVKRMATGEKWYQGQAVNPYPLLVGAR